MSYLENAINEVKSFVEEKTNYINTLDLMESFKEFECNKHQSDLIIDIHDNDKMDYIKGDNTYNWGCNISNHLNFYIYKMNDKFYFLMKTHLSGDVRCNYSEQYVLSFDDEYEFYEIFYNHHKIFEITIDNKIYSIEVDPLNDGAIVYDHDGEELYTTYEDLDSIEYLKMDIIKQLKDME